jgi:ferrochelatase
VTGPQALLIVSFGGPEKSADVLPFLENVLRGRAVPRERLLAVAEHYYHVGGKSPINDRNRALIAALREQIALPIYWGNRNWHPFLADALREMKRDGIERALAFFTSAYSSYSGCRQYREDIARAQAELGAGAPEIVKLPQFYNHPGFIGAMRARVAEALAQLPGAQVVYTAHSIPMAMAQASRYVAQLEEACRLTGPGRLVFQSRSGAPGQPWLEPDINDWLRAERPEKVAIVPIGFISDHMEVIYDLDTEARATCNEMGVQMVRAGTVGVHPLFIDMIREMVANPPRPLCTAECCASGRPQGAQASPPARN